MSIKITSGIICIGMNLCYDAFAVTVIGALNGDAKNPDSAEGEPILPSADGR